MTLLYRPHPKAILWQLAVASSGLGSPLTMTAAAVLHRAPTRLLIIVCLYTACVTFKPSQPFLVAFLECFKGISHADVMYKVFPVWTYSYLVLLLPLAASA